MRPLHCSLACALLGILAIANEAKPSVSNAPLSSFQLPISLVTLSHLSSATEISSPDRRAPLSPPNLRQKRDSPFPNYNPPSQGDPSFSPPSPGGDDSTTFFSGLKAKESARRTHGILMSVSTLLLLPLGGLLMRLLGKVWVHALWQVLSVVLLLAGLGLGVLLARDTDRLYDNAHTVLGTVVLVLLLVVQPVLGWAQHLFYRRFKRRGGLGWGHVVLGRGLLVLGVVNGGLGIGLARRDREGMAPGKAYIGVAASMGMFYVVAILFTAWWRRGRGESAEK